MGEFDALARVGEEHGVVAHNVPSSKRMHADLALATFAWDAFASVLQVVVAEIARPENGLCQHQGRSAGRVLLHAVMHLQNFRVVGEWQNVGGFFGEVAKQVDANRKVARPNRGDLRGDREQFRPLFLGVAGCAADDRLAQSDRGFEYAASRGVERKVDDDVGIGEGSVEIVAKVDFAGDGVAGCRSGLGDHGPHTTFESVDANVDAHD